MIDRCALESKYNPFDSLDDGISVKRNPSNNNNNSKSRDRRRIKPSLDTSHRNEEAIVIDSSKYNL